MSSKFQKQINLIIVKYLDTSLIIIRVLTFRGYMKIYIILVNEFKILETNKFDDCKIFRYQLDYH